MVVAPSDVRHDGISLLAEGTVSLQLSAKSVGIIEAFYNSVKVCQIHVNLNVKKYNFMPFYLYFILWI